MEMQNMSVFGLIDCLTEASVGWKCFGTYIKDRDFYTFSDKYVSVFIRRSIKGDRCGSFNRYFESKHFDQIFLTVKNHLKTNDNEISNVVDEHLNFIITKRDEIKLEYENGGKTIEK